ncbi:MAG: NAD(P)-dependent oxidoreductase [Alphaproteobacteria bacterium]|nr:NAD(P)-dependent oxidoreductase [Alphaproteobacteria bacterium]
MIIVDTALNDLEANGTPVRVGLVGPGFMGYAIARQLILYAKGIRLAAVSSRDPARAAKAFTDAGVAHPRFADDLAGFSEAVRCGIPVFTSNWRLLCESDEIDVVIDVTGAVEFGAHLALAAIEHGKHLILSNAELDGTVGALLKRRGEEAGAIVTTCDGDQPGVQMNLYRFVRGMGIRPVLCGNIKGLQDRYRNPTTQIPFAKKWGQKPEMVSAFADGTKISFEQALVANATGMTVARRGMTGASFELGTPLEEAIASLPLERAAEGTGFVDYIVGASPLPAVFVVGTTDDPVQQHYLRLYKLGDGPFYLYYTPYHLCHFEMPNTVGRVMLFGDTVGAPISGLMVEVVTAAKTDLRAGVTLDGMGQYMTYGTCENADVARQENLLPIGVAEGCRLTRDVRRDEALTYDDVELPPGRLIDRLRREQDDLFCDRAPAAERRESQAVV